MPLNAEISILNAKHSVRSASAIISFYERWKHKLCFVSRPGRTWKLGW